MERVKNMTKKLMEEKQKADSRIAEVEQDIEAMKLKLEEVENEKTTLLTTCEEKEEEVEAITAENAEEIKRIGELELEIENNIRVIDSNKNELHNLEQEKIHKEEKHTELEGKLKAFIEECMEMSAE